MDKTQITKDDAEEYTNSLAQHLVASYRQIELAHRMGVPAALGFSSLKDWVNTRLGGYMKLSVDQRKEAIKELEAQGYTKNTKMAEIVGVSEMTIRRDRSTNVVQVNSEQGKPKRQSTNVEQTKLAEQLKQLTEKINNMNEENRKLKGELSIERRVVRDLQQAEVDRLAEEQEKEMFDKGIGVSDEPEEELNPLNNPKLMEELSRREVVSRVKTYIQWISALNNVMDDLSKYDNYLDDEVKVLQGISDQLQTAINKVQSHLSDTQRRRSIHVIK